MAELDSTSGIGLIEKIRRGLGKPDIIYVKNFVGVVAEQTRETADEFAEVPKSNFKKSQNQICRSSKIELQEVPEKDFKKSQDKTSRSSNMTPQEVSLWDSNYTYKSNTYENYTNLINPSDDSNRALEKFAMKSFKDVVESGLTPKNFITPTSFDFRAKDYYKIGDMFATTNFLVISAPEISDEMLADILNMEDSRHGQTI